MFKSSLKWFIYTEQEERDEDRGRSEISFLYHFIFSSHIIIVAIFKCNHFLGIR